MNLKELLAKLKSLGLALTEKEHTAAELAGVVKAALTAARDIAKVAEDAGRDFTAEERAKVADLLETAKGLKAHVKQIKGDAEMRAAIETMGEGIDVADDGNGGAPKGRGKPKLSVGQHFVSAKAYQAWLKEVAPNGRIPDSAKGLRSPAIGMKGFGLFGKKDVLTGMDAESSAGIFVSSDDTGIYEPLGRYPLNLRDLVSVRQTGSDTVEFVRQVTQVNAAAPVAEANVTTFNGATGEVSGIKPEGSMTFERVTETVKTIAVWIPATKRALSDAAQLRGLIDQELREDLNEELENQMLNGNGTGENFAGLANTANTLVQAWNTDLITTTRKAITNLQTNGKTTPTGWLFNPADWEKIELLKDAENRYYWGGPMARGPKTLWGVPVAESFYQPAGFAWLGNWSKAVLWDREEANISVSDSHADFFIRNMVAILAELRAAFGVIRPTAFVEVDLTA